MAGIRRYDCGSVGGQGGGIELIVLRIGGNEGARFRRHRCSSPPDGANDLADVQVFEVQPVEDILVLVQNLL